MKLTRKTVAAGVGAAGVLGVALYIAVPAAADPSPSASPSTSARKHQGKGGHEHQGKNGRRHRGHPGAAGLRGVHGETTVRRKDGFHVMTWQRGQITGRSGAAVTVRSADGTSWRWTTDAGSKIRAQGRRSALSDLVNGAQVVVVGDRSGDTRTVKIIRMPKK
ncbi:hypothetical protein [Spirillospora sp. NBC_01491]|uniref:hypothetical protein n=1 Tax=Spirillospora sp. NBC_01491 TaxID=2976007 RepID=UPI002E32BAC5|nr:hypothetical protein [Spirillospora sp. NBC_01491]